MVRRVRSDFWVLALILAASVDAAVTPLDVADQSAPAFTVYSTQDGLSDEIWNTVEIDGRGFVWGGSASALARFDGYRWTPWPVNGAKSLVRDLQLMSDGSFWAMFEREGLARLAGDDWQLQPPQPLFLQRFADSERSDGTRDYWVAHQHGFWKWTPGGWAPEADLSLPGIPYRLAQTQTMFGAPRQWAATNSGLWFREQGSDGSWQAWQVHPDPRFGTMPGTDAIRTTDRGVEELWVLSYGGGIGRIRDDGARIWRESQGELPTEAMYVARATHGPGGERLLWIASRAGLLRVRGDEIRAFDRRHGLPSDAVRWVEVQRGVDGVDQLWLATEGGIARASLGSSQWQTVSLLGARSNGIFGVLIEPDGRGGERLWTGSSADGLGLFEGGQWRIFQNVDAATPIRNMRIITSVTGPDGKPWRLLSMVGALAEIDDQYRFTRIAAPWDGDINDAASFVFARQYDGQWEQWFGTLRSGIYRLRAGAWTRFLASDGGKPVNALRIVEQIDNHGRSWLWAATSEGLVRYDNQHWKPLDADALGLPADAYRTLTLIADNDRALLWAGTNRHGLVRLDVSDPSRPLLVTTPPLPDLPDPTIYSILADSRGRLYICTNNGVQQLSPLPTGGYSERIFRRRDGLVHDECNTNSQFVDAHDRYWVGTLGGLSVYDPRILTTASPARPKPLYLTDVQVDGVTRRPPSGVLTLDAGTRELSLRYSLLAGQREPETQYRTQLLGFDPQPGPWTPDHSRSFSALPPGNYSLLVEARDFAGATSSAELIALEVLPSWWQRPWIRGLFGLLAALLVLATVMLYNRNLRARQRLLTREVEARTTDLDTANRRLTELSYQDPLTGVANRRRLMEVLDNALPRAIERGLPLGLIVIDVDHFKAYNDQHGHLCGDAALRLVAQTLERSVRSQDLLARYGGEEFAALLIDADLATTLDAAERMRESVAALPAQARGDLLHSITISAGALSCIPAHGSVAADLLSRADQALYQAKHAGRNRVQAVE